MGILEKMRINDRLVRSEKCWNERRKRGDARTAGLERELELKAFTRYKAARHEARKAGLI